MSDAQPATGPKRTHRVLRNVAIVLAVVLVVIVGGGFLVVHHLNGNIKTIDPTKALGTDRPSALPKKKGEPNAPVNILLIGSDTRKGQGNAIGGETPGCRTPRSCCTCPRTAAGLRRQHAARRDGAAAGRARARTATARSPAA